MTAAVPALLAAAVGAGVLVGCTERGDQEPDPSTTASSSATPPPPDPDTAALLAALARESALLAAYADPITSTAGLATAAEEARADHALHVRAIESLLGVAPSDPPTATPTTASASPHPDAVAAARALLAAERAAADAGLVVVGSGVGARTRRLLAEIAASEAQHATALYIGLREGLVKRGVARPGPAPSS